MVGADVIFATNTSTLPITSLAETSQKPENFIGIHFFSPVDRMMLVEIIMGEKTGAKALATAHRLRARDQEDADRRQRLPRLLRQPLRRQLHPRRPPDADGGRAAGDDRERRAHGRHAGRAAVAQRRGRASTSAGRSCRRPRKTSAPNAVDPAQEKLLEAMVVKEQRLRPQERQGLLRLSRAGAEDRCGRASPRSPARQLDPDTSRVQDLKDRFLYHAGARGRALHGGEGRHRSARGRCRLDPRLRLRALHRRRAVANRRHRREGVRRAGRGAGEQIRSALRAERGTGGDGGEGRELLQKFAPAQKAA